jgi:hypothetical protein
MAVDAGDEGCRRAFKPARGIGVRSAARGGAFRGARDGLTDYS